MISLWYIPCCISGKSYSPRIPRTANLSGYQKISGFSRALQMLNWIKIGIFQQVSGRWECQYMFPQFLWDLISWHFGSSIMFYQPIEKLSNQHGTLKRAKFHKIAQLGYNQNGLAWFIKQGWLISIIWNSCMADNINHLKISKVSAVLF